MVKASGLGLDVLMVETVDYHKARRLAVHVAAAVASTAALSQAMIHRFALPSWSAVAALGPLITAVVLSEKVRRDDPSGTWSPAHRVTLLRGVLIGLVAGSAGASGDALDPRGVVAVAALAFSLDGVDGWLARRTETASAYGARLDMELDAAFVVVLSALVWTWDRAGTWVLLCGAARYIWWVAECLIPWFRRPLFPSAHRRHGCFIAVTALILALWPWPTPVGSVAAAGIATITLAVSFGVDAVWLFRRRGHPC